MTRRIAGLIFLSAMTFTGACAAGRAVGGSPVEESTGDARTEERPSSNDGGAAENAGNVAIYYRDFGYSSGLVRLGRIDRGLDTLASRRGEFSVRIERVD
jgi:hypothetical protein